MIKLITSIALLSFVLIPAKDEFKKYRAVESYEFQPGIAIKPLYSANGEICEISIEKPHYSNNIVDFDALLSREQILAAFDELAPKESRGWAGWGKPGEMEVTESDSGMATTIIPYQNVTLQMYGRKDNKKYITAIIAWKNRECDAK